jgi:hypothetical protein
MAVEVQTGATFSAQAPRVLFETSLSDDPAAAMYSVAPDGQRFLMVWARTAADTRPLTVVLNWAGLLRR